MPVKLQVMSFFALFVALSFFASHIIQFVVINVFAGIVGCMIAGNNPKLLDWFWGEIVTYTLLFFAGVLGLAFLGFKSISSED
jgi:hypothetical protein